MGGRLNAETFAVGEPSGADWAAAAVAELAAMPNVRLMAAHHGPRGLRPRHLSARWSGSATICPCPRRASRARSCGASIRSRAILCGGATERPIAFENNDRPGIMLAGALRAYANRWGVKAGERVAVFTNNDDGLRTATRPAGQGRRCGRGDRQPSRAATAARHPASARGRGDRQRRAARADVHHRAAGEWPDREDCRVDALGVSGGWNPNVNIHSHHRSRPVWDDAIAAFVPGADGPPGLLVAGAAAGRVLDPRRAADRARMRRLRRWRTSDRGRARPAARPRMRRSRITPLWHVRHGKGRAWIDQQNDVTVKDIKLAHQENFTSSSI